MAEIDPSFPVVLLRPTTTDVSIFQWEIDWGPVDIRVATGESYRHTISFAEEVNVLEIETFIGVDRGHICEADFQVYDQWNRVIYRRSMHKETVGIYDSRDCRVTHWNPGNSLVIHTHCHPTEGGYVRWHPAITVTLLRDWRGSGSPIPTRVK